TEPRAEAGPEWTASAGVVAAQVVAEFATGLATVLVQRTPLLRGEIEAGVLAALMEGAAGERGKWMVQGLSRF
ncbi:hypothetical protein, partial [Mycobacterium sp.]|uniref:hypothetical protein n=1 Tax=Mycobacterium sp. TaxID=1785 RepID=UPI003CC6CDC0